MTIISTTYTLTQKDFRFRNDDGSETTATWIAAVNTNINLAAGSAFRLRLAIGETDSSCVGFTDTYNLAYSKNGGGYVQCTTATTTDVAISTSSNVTNGTATTQQISSPDSFSAGVLVVNTNTSNSFNTAVGTSNEIEWVLKLGASVAANTTFDFQFQQVTTMNVTRVYTVTPRLTIPSNDVQGLFFG